MDFSSAYANVLTGSVKEPYANPQAISNSIRRVKDTIQGLTNAQQKKGTITGGLRAANSDATQSRMALPMSDVAKFGSQSFSGSTKQSPSVQSQEPDMVTQYRNLSSADLDRVKGLDNQELQANINRIKQYQPLANNEANRAYGMQLATQFPYKKYETESSSAREIMNNAQSAIPTFLNRATASRLNPVSLSL